MGRLRVFALLVVILVAGCGSGAHSSQRSKNRGASGATGMTGSTGSNVPAGTTSSAGDRCKAPQLRLAYTSSQGATGHIEASFQLRNVSQTGCTLFGYPGARMLDAKGNALPTRVQRGGAFYADTRRRPTKVSLAPGQSARFVFGYSDNPEIGSGATGTPRSCPKAARLEVTPPNSYSQLVISVSSAGSFAPCGGVLVASPVY
jgi:hypothetical protein